MGELYDEWPPPFFRENSVDQSADHSGTRCRGLFNAVPSLFWEVVVGSGRLGLLRSNVPLAQVWAFVKKSLAFNAGQYMVEIAGLKFGNLYSIYDLIDSLNV